MRRETYFVFFIRNHLAGPDDQPALIDHPLFYCSNNELTTRLDSRNNVDELVSATDATAVRLTYA